MNGFLLIDKEKGVTSFDVIRKVRKILGEKKVGHAGTLDPLATGLLVIAIGEGTKLLEFFVGHDKEYEVLGRFGYSSDTYDADGSFTEGKTDLKFTRKDIESVIGRRFIGVIEQVPPKFSALKIKGKRAYEIARKGGEIEMKARKVRIDLFEVIDFNWPEVSFRVKCGSGTYIRSLIHDLGQDLGCGAYVEELRRTRVGGFSVEMSKKVEQGLISLEDIGKKFDYWELSSEEFEGLKDGRVLMGKKIEQGRVVMAFYKEKLVGVLEGVVGGVKYKKVILVN